MKTKKHILPLAAAMGSLALAATSANGAVTITDLGHMAVSGNNAAVIAVQPVGIGDLLESATVNFTGGLSFGSQLKNANDGLAVSNGGSTGATGNVFVPSIGSTLEFVLDASYDIGQIDAFTLWNAPSDNRTAHSYTIDVSTDGGSNYSLLQTVSLTSVGATVQGPNIRGVSLTDDGGVLASGIDAIRFTFNAVPDGLSPAVFAEIDVYAVPEPSSMALLGLGGLALLRRRRK